MSTSACRRCGPRTSQAIPPFVPPARLGPIFRDGFVVTLLNPKTAGLGVFTAFAGSRRVK